jgi:hypothetical protein
MDLIKQYINQSVNIAANNLRLNNQQIEVVALLKEVINKSENLCWQFVLMRFIIPLLKLPSIY